LKQICLQSLPWHKLNNKKILITGATGLICSCIIDILLYRNEKFSENITIYAVGRDKVQALKRFERFSHSKSFIFIEQDIQDPLQTDAQIDFFIHGASNSHPAAYTADPVGTMLANILGINNILQIAKKDQNQRVLYISSSEIYGEPSDEVQNISEDYSGYVNPLNMRSCYPSSKRAAESLCASYAKQHHINTVIVRPCHVYGPTMTPKDSRAVATFLRNAISGNDISMESSGTQVRSYCYVTDAVSALLIVLLTGKSGEAYNISNSNSTVSIKDLASIISQKSGQKLISKETSDTTKQGFTPIQRMILDTSKLEKLGWQAKTSLENGIERTLAILKKKHNH